ncbi:MAG: hypothetical protein GAK35_03563 [Herbaspirillum frisingense]|uniref:PXPV repeat-containing protein n=1 Tax=Herbaspirillum frisingense TaxID=92645 RepID=A0A7V8FU19_9BURK|nr:MAG: hypothetical protein GAK35_03563 [Herbaspirillum frisingense]
MASKKIASVLIATTLLASAAVVSTPAMAHGRGNDGVAIAAGIIGAVAIGSLIANANSVPAQPVYQAPPQPVYYQAPQQVYYQAPQQVYYEQPRYYAPPPRPVRYVERTEVRTYRYDDRPSYYYER